MPMPKSFCALDGQRHREAPAGARVLDGVVDQIAEGVPDRGLVDPNRRQRVARRQQLHDEAFALQARAKGLQNVTHDIRHVVLFQLVERATRFDSREIEDVVDQLREAPPLRLDVLAVLADLGRVVHATEAHQFAEDADRTERRAQFVRHVGDEIALDLRELHLAVCRAHHQDDSGQQNAGQDRRERHVHQEVGACELGARRSAAAQGDGPFAERGAEVALDLEMRLDVAGVGEDLLVESVPDGHHELGRGAFWVQLAAEERGQGLPGEDVEVDDYRGNADELRLLVGHEAQEHRVAGIALVNDDVLRVDARRRLLGAHLRIGQDQTCGRGEAPRVDAHAPLHIIRHDAALELADEGHQEEVPRIRIARSRAGGREAVEDGCVEAVARRREDPRRDAQHPLAGFGEVKGDLPGEQVELDLKRSAVRHRRVALEIDQEPVLEAEQHDQRQEDDGQRDPEDATASERSAPESPEQ
jgi:hypothetical protein